MQIETISARQAVDNAFLQEPIYESDFEAFRSQMLRMLNHADDAVDEGESEEHLKNLIKPFLSNSNFDDHYYVNTNKKKDLAIHNGKTRKSSVGVMIEAKEPTNKSQMITESEVNKKAFQQCILYYLRERITNGNEDIKHIIITDVYQWYIFDAQDFERLFYESKKLRNWYTEWKQDQKVSSGTPFIYNHLSEFIDETEATIKAATITITGYRNLLEKDKLSRDEQKSWYRFISCLRLSICSRSLSPVTVMSSTRVFTGSCSISWALRNTRRKAPTILPGWMKKTASMPPSLKIPSPSSRA